MKIKKGFVSNSSSASFIFVASRIVDEAKFKEWMVENNIKLDYNKQIFYSDQIQGKEGLVERAWGDNSIDDFMGQVDIRSVVKDAKQHNDARYFISEGSGNDSGFEVYDDNGDWLETDYSMIDLEDFDEIDRLIYNATPAESGLQVIETCFYAGRNG